VPDSREIALKEAYEDVKRECSSDLLSATAASAIKALALLSSHFLASECSTADLISRVPGKKYAAYTRNDNRSVLSRPANLSLFIGRDEEFSRNLSVWSSGELARQDLEKTVYTMALAPCLCMELFDRQNKKGPATYFECLVGHIFAKQYELNPKKRATITVGTIPVALTMDFLFDWPTGTGVHLPVKMSTRERVVQAWAHQRILDGAYGVGTYLGIMVLFAETKLNSRTREVVEICVPGQWLVYQTHLATLDTIYYFDMPGRYEALSREHQDVFQIRPFVDFLATNGSSP
jgi:hypothetical protein